MEVTTETLVFGGGCFWCTEAIFESLRGVRSVLPGYTDGTIPNPTYEQVRTGTTGHAEAIKIEYDPAAITPHDLLIVFFATHDPTTLNRQGADVGTQYRSVILYTTQEQKTEAEKIITELNTSGAKVVTELKPLALFYPAEQYHRQYYKNNSDAPYCQVVINPKIEKLKRRFNALLK